MKALPLSTASDEEPDDVIHNNDVNAKLPDLDDGSLKVGEYVKVIKGLFSGLYATVLGKSYGDELEIQYFENSFGKYILKDNDIDSRPPNELVKVAAHVDSRSRHTFYE